MFKIKKIFKNVKGSEVVEKMLMVITSVTLVAVAIGFMNKFINNAIEKQGGQIGGGTNQQIVLPTPNLDGNIQNENVNFDDKLLNRMWQVKPDADFSFFKGGKKYYFSNGAPFRNPYGLITIYVNDFYPETNELEVKLVEKNIEETRKEEKIMRIPTSNFGEIPLIFTDNMSTKEKIELYEWLKTNCILASDKNAPYATVFDTLYSENSKVIFDRCDYFSSHNYENFNACVLNEKVYYFVDSHKENYSSEFVPAKVYNYDINTGVSTPLKIEFEENVNFVTNSFYVVDNKGFQITNCVTVFEPSTLTYKKTADLPNNLIRFGSRVLVGNKIYCFNGEKVTINNDTLEETISKDNNIYIYDTNTNTFETGPLFDFQLNGSRGIYHRGKIYFVGNKNLTLADEKLFDNIFAYDIKTNTFETIAEISTIRNGDYNYSFEDFRYCSLEIENENILIYCTDKILKFSLTNNSLEIMLNKCFKGLTHIYPFKINNKKYTFDTIYIYGVRKMLLLSELFL